MQIFDRNLPEIYENIEHKYSRTTASDSTEIRTQDYPCCHPSHLSNFRTHGAERYTSNPAVSLLHLKARVKKHFTSSRLITPSVRTIR